MPQPGTPPEERRTRPAERQSLIPRRLLSLEPQAHQREVRNVFGAEGLVEGISKSIRPVYGPNQFD
jgi:hypothetical protein